MTERVVQPARIARLKSRKDFLALRRGFKYAAPTLVLQSRPTDPQNETVTTCRVGFTVTNKVGNAVIRNRIKRRLREAVSQIFPKKSKLRHDYAVIGRRAALVAPFRRIVQDLENALDRVHAHESQRAKQDPTDKILPGTKHRN